MVDGSVDHLVVCWVVDSVVKLVDSTAALMVANSVVWLAGY